jgi:transcriptional regulator with XRE-family HTH domain
MYSPLGEFLRARRQRTTIDQVGLPRVGDRRRTPGLRRDEVAMLAGVSIDYYTRLEQGRERHPSDQVLDALARVLRLDPEAGKHLHELARPRAYKRRPSTDRVSPDVLQLMDSWDHKPAFVVNRRLDVLAKNPPAVALVEGLNYSDNLMRMTFLDPASREFYLDWEKEARFKVALTRAAVGADGDDTYLLELVEELSLKSEDFRRLWACHDVRANTRASERMYHREVGEMTLRYEAFAINSAPGQELVVFQAEPGSPSERALARLSMSIASGT